MNLLQLFLGQIPEAIYFSIFMILTKSLKEKRAIFIILMIIEYVLLKMFIPYNLWFQILYTFMMYIILKILYKNKAQIIDIFTFTIGSIFLIITSILCCLLLPNNMILISCVNRVMIFTFLFMFRYKLREIQNLYKLLWNRTNRAKRMKSTTFRSMNIVIFNLLFYAINVCIIYRCLPFQ